MNVIHNESLDYEIIIKNERERISSLIHNQLAQDLTALSIHSEAIQGISKNNEVLMHIHHITNLITSSRKNVKDLIWSLNSNKNDPEESLSQAIKKLLLFWKETTGRVVQKFEVYGDIDAIPSHLRTICFESVKEAITNVYRHAETENLVVNIGVDECYVEIMVSDDGIGFNAEYSNGLYGISHKLKSVHGLLKICSNNNCGTTLHIKVPLKEGY